MAATILACSSQVALAQPSFAVGEKGTPKSGMANSPLSRIGIGDLNDRYNSIIRGMGGVATAYNNPFTINSANPASYSFLKSTTYEVGVNAISNNISIGSGSINSSTYSIGNLAMGFPVSKNWGLSFGYMPYSNIYYNAKSDGVAAGLDSVTNYYFGKGALHNVHLGTAYKYKGFSLGLNANYIFGNRINSSSLENYNYYANNAEYVSYQSLGGFQFKAGAMYQHIFKEKYYVHIGATYDVKANVNTNQDFYAMSYRYMVGADGSIAPGNVDTLQALSYKERKNTLTLPSELAFGIHVGKSAYWNVGIDYRNTNWKDYSFDGTREGIADNTYRISLGGEVTPNPEALENKFLNNTTFRLGAYYGTDYRMFGAEQINYFGGSFAIGLPLFRAYGSNGRGQVNVALDMGRASNGITGSNGYNNNFMKFTLGFNLNDMWFIKRKFD